MLRICHNRVRKTSFKSTALLCILLLALVCAKTQAQTSRNSVKEEDAPAKPLFIDRWAFKTNAFEWLLTIPNFGVEFDLVNSPYNQMTVGLTAKYNWNTYHKLQPPVVFNLLDVRPEFRYYYRTTERKAANSSDEKTKMSAKEWFDTKIFTTERKNARPWRAQYIGAYINYASYTFKLSETGIQGHVIGLGASAGYDIPMYQYKNGAIDVELGFSVGLQMATKEKFKHNADTYKYFQVTEGVKPGFHITPFPVVSELRLAFVWRHKSIKEKVQEDVEKRKMMERMEKAQAQVDGTFQNMNQAKFDEQLSWTMNEQEIKALKADTERYRGEFINYLDTEIQTLTEVVIPGQLITDEMKAKLSKRIPSLRAKAISAFDKEINYNPDKKPEKVKEGKEKKSAAKEKNIKDGKEKKSAAKEKNVKDGKEKKSAAKEKVEKQDKSDKKTKVDQKTKADKKATTDKKATDKKPKVKKEVKDEKEKKPSATDKKVKTEKIKTKSKKKK